MRNQIVPVKSKNVEWKFTPQFWYHMRAHWAMFRLTLKEFTPQTILMVCGLFSLCFIFFGFLAIRPHETIILVQKASAVDQFVETTVDETLKTDQPIVAVKEERVVVGEVAPQPAKKYITTSPRTSEDLTTQQFINKYAATAQKLQKKYHVPASITLGQGLLESDNGNSVLARRANNFFGIKCFAKRHRGCCIKACDDSNDDSFVIFDSPTLAFEGHSKFLQKDRYKPLQKYGKDYRKWAYGLKSKGYATNKKYAEILIGIIERNNLQRFDR